MKINKHIFFCLIVSLPLMVNAQNWPGFRGPGGQGISNNAGLPEVWNDSTGIYWKTKIPGIGWSSPIVWENYVFLTTVADSGTSCQVVALDMQSGEIIWNKKLFEQKPGHLHKKNSYASPTPVTDGQKVFAVFGDGSIGALNYKGDIVWTNREIKHYSEHGLGVSPVLYDNLVIIPFDGSGKGDEADLGWQKPWDRAVIAAFDKETGEIAWKARRGLSRIAHVTPALMKVGDNTQLVSAAGDVVQGFNPGTGDLLWTVNTPGEGVVPSIVIGNGVVFTASGWGEPTIRAIRPDTNGGAEIVWEQKKNVPKIPSFIYRKPYLFTITEHGFIMCLDELTGEIVWTDRISAKFSASLVLVGAKIYLLDEMACTTIIEAGPEFKVIARNELSGKCQASMAVAKDKIIIRTENNLYCIK